MRIVLISIVAAGVLLGFQNCSQVSFETSSASLMAQQIEFLSSATIEIDDNAEYTRQSLVQLKLFSIRAVEMKISNEENCADGTWEPYTTAKVWTLSKSNSQVKAYAQFKDIVGNISACVTDDIVHDDQAPTANFANSQNLITNNPALTLTWTSQDNLSGVDFASCKGPDGMTVQCSNSYSVNSSADGAKTIVVRVSDKAGNQTPELKYDWLVDRTPPTVSINSRPATVTGSGAASLGFVGQDALAGIAKYSCRIDNGAWADCTSPKSYTGLIEGAHKFEVVAVDKAGNSSTVDTANWTVDMTAPSLSFTQTPAAISATRAATFAFVGVDDGVAITRFDCRLDTAAFANCSSPVNFSNLGEGSHSFEVRGYDSASNVSQPIKYTWTVDVTAPTVNIATGPAALGNSSSASFTWSASDSGSGVKLVDCKIDSAAYTSCAAAGQSFSGLAAGSHTITVRATDNAGNTGTATRTWVVDLTAPVVQILSGPDAYVKVTNAQFTFSATDASGIGGYECRVDSGAYAACSSPNLVQSLAEGGHTFFVRATDMAGNVSQPASRSWTIDMSPPVIRVLSAPVAIKQGDPAVISFEVIDLSSGLNGVLCGLSSPTSSIIACQTKQTVDLGTALGVGSYVFDIQATDKVGNMITEKVNFQVTAKVVICDPFVVGGDKTCNGGLVGDIFYLNDAQQTAFKALSNKTVDYFYANGIQVNALLALKQLFVSTRSFTEGFPSSANGALIQDDTGATLHEYFAFRLETVLKLDATLDQPGWYQFAVLSDDGAMVLTKPTGSSTYSSTLITNDGDHSTKMGCSSTAIYIDDATRLPMMVKYYQGPRTEIALTLMWRRVAAMNSALDSYCGVSGNDAFFGPAPYTNFTSSRYADLISASRGWRVINPSNLIAPPR